MRAFFAKARNVVIRKPFHLFSFPSQCESNVLPYFFILPSLHLEVQPAFISVCESVPAYY